MVAGVSGWGHIGLTSFGAQGVTQGQGFFSIWMSSGAASSRRGRGAGGHEEVHVVHVNLAEHVKESVGINKCPHARYVGLRSQ